jgi:hypothetical protein
MIYRLSRVRVSKTRLVKRRCIFPKMLSRGQNCRAGPVTIERKATEAARIRIIEHRIATEASTFADSQALGWGVLRSRDPQIAQTTAALEFTCSRGHKRAPKLVRSRNNEVPPNAGPGITLVHPA